MQVPRILAIDDVHLISEPHLEDAVRDFYVDVLGLRPAGRGEGRLRLAGIPRSGPKVVVELTQEKSPSGRRQILIQTAALTDLAEELLDRGLEPEWTQGFSFFDRRLTVLDPAGNRVELVEFHPL